MFVAEHAFFGLFFAAGQLFALLAPDPGDRAGEDPDGPVPVVVEPAADKRRFAVGGDRDGVAEPGGAFLFGAAGELSARWVQVVPERVKTQAAPFSPSSPGAPISAVLPSPESATLVPNPPCPDLAGGGELRALLTPDSTGAREHPGRALGAVVLPAADQRRVAVGGEGDETPNSLLPSSPPVSFDPCWLHTPATERVNTQAAPTAVLSSGPPTSAVPPSPRARPPRRIGLPRSRLPGQLRSLLGPDSRPCV